MNQYITTLDSTNIILTESYQDFFQHGVFLKAYDYFVLEQRPTGSINSAFFFANLIDHLVHLYFFIQKYFGDLNNYAPSDYRYIFDLVYSKQNILQHDLTYLDNLPVFVENGLKLILHLNATSIFEAGLAVMFVVFCLTFYFSFYHDTYGESFLDFDYLISTSLILSEKELSAIDDIINVLSIVGFLFGWFFYTYGWSLFIGLNELALVLLFLPLLWYTLFFIPLCLLFDFSFIFINYLRGVSTTPSFLVEALFDYVSGFAFFLRTFVQNVRFAIMLFVCYGLQEIVSFTRLPEGMYSFSHNTNIIEAAARCKPYQQNYALIIFTIDFVITSLYELAHTFFVLGVQFTSFLVMVFWLFSFLYTCFTSEIMEQFFEDVRLRFIARHKLKK